MARKRVESPTSITLTSWDDVDNTLRQIGEIDRDLALIEGDTNHAIDDLKAKAKSDSKPLLDRKAGLELAVKEFCEANRGEFAKKKTITLTFGSVGFRLSTKVLVKKVGDTLQALKDLKLHGCIRTKEEIDKEALKNLDSETLAEVGATLKTENVFGYEVDRTKIAEAA